MASSSSSSSIIASSAADACRYDVFLSFRGEDTRLSFTDHLYERLTNIGFVTFRDKEGINGGEEVTPEIKKAIKGSGASIVVLSENYATSTWCLDELVLILQQRKDYGHFVVPVFYKVEPTDVRNQINSYAIQVKEASPKWTIQNVNLWKKALTEVSHLSGEIQSGSKYETEVLKEIVDVIYRKVCRKEVLLPSNLTGMTSLDEEIVSWLDGSDVEHLAICGMPGSGKTTLAKYLYNSKWKLFENASFVEDIGRKCEESNTLGKLQLQQQLLHDILGGKNRKIPGVSQGTCGIEEALLRKKALIVLDDIVEKHQLVALLGTKMINPQSKIIITTTVSNIEEWLESRSSRFRKYKMRSLNSDESLELLCRHAFKSKFPKEDFKELAVKGVHYCEGNPLALELLGAYLSMNNTIKFWRSILTGWDRVADNNLQRVLIECYNGLPNDLYQELFLHIACFFVGKDKDYVEQILDDDCCATSGIQILCSRCLLSVSSRNKLMMHRSLQEMGKQIVRKESKNPAKRSRVWLSSDSYDILSNGEGSKTVEGLALKMEMLRKEKSTVEPLNLKTDALQKMKKLKLLHLNSVYLDGSYKNVSEDLRWLCWIGFQNERIPLELLVKNLVAIDMSSSKLVVFDPPMALHFLKYLNLQDSHKLTKIHNISRIPKLETLILWNCHSLVHVCETIGNLERLEVLHMTGCENMWREQTVLLVGQEASSSNGVVAEQPTFSFPCSLQKLFLKDCNLDRTNSFPLSFTDQQSLQYLNLVNGRFDSLPRYDHLLEIRVLDLSFCSRLKCLEGLPNTLAELYVYYCTSLERVTFKSPKFTLLEFGYKGCTSLSEIEGFIKLVPVTKLKENDLAHMKWLRKYQDQEVCLVGNDDLTEDRSSFVQMLYEFGIMSTSLPDITDRNMKPEYYVSESSSLSFDVPLCPANRRLKGLDVTFKYELSGDDGWAWFCKISTTNGVDLMYNPIVFGKPDSGKVGIWLSYWPIGDKLDTGDHVSVSIVVMHGLEVHECGASLVYVDNQVSMETLENNKEWVEILGGDLSGFKLSTGAYYLCRRDFFKLLEVGRLTPDQFRLLVGDTFDITEVRRWRKTGRPKQMNLSFTELKAVRCIIHGPELEEIYKIPEMSKSSCVDKVLNSTSNMPEEKMKPATSSKFSDTILNASCSSSSIIASPGVKASSYDVFLSFGGENTGDSLTVHLYDALMRIGIRTFKNNREFNTSEQLNMEIESAITESRASVVVLSDTYATSTRCLDELVLILKQQREYNHFILPIYDQVGPSDVRNQENTFAMEVKASSRWTDDNVNLWKKALKEVAHLDGMVSLWPETEFLKEVVDTIYSKLESSNVHLPINLLIRSIDSLSHDNKELFLHIACFFVGEDKDYVEKILEHVYSASSGIKTLCKIGLLSISPTKKLMMHRQLQKRGITIVREEALNNPPKRSRIRIIDDSYNILPKHVSSKSMEGLALDMERARVEMFPIKPEMESVPYETAEQIILRWDATAFEEARVQMIFEGDRQDIGRYLQAVDRIQLSLESATLSDDGGESKKMNSTIQIAMARLEDEFRNILISHASPIETETLAESMKSTHLTPRNSTSINELSGNDDYSSRGEEDSLSRDEACCLELGENSNTIWSYRCMSSIPERDLIPSNIVCDLRSIAERMIAAGYFRECVKVYSSVRKSAVAACFKKLEVEKLSIDAIQRMEWEALNAKIGKWIRAAEMCVRVLFASEKRLCEQIFGDLGTAAHDACFMETVKAPAIQLFNFAEAISISRCAPERLFKILDLHYTLFHLLSDINTVFDGKSTESIRSTEILARLAETARGMLNEFENAVHHEPSRVPVPGGTIHPLTRYVMNYISLISDYKQTLGELIVSKPATGSRYSDDQTTPEMDFTDYEDLSPLALHLIWIIVNLQFNLEGKSKHYKDISLAHLFIMNNVHYIVQKIKGSPELREMIGDKYLRNLTAKFRQASTRYQRATWVGVLYCFRDEGLYVSGSFSSGVSKSALRERFKSFNAMFDDVHETQALWQIPDTQLREEIIISISDQLIPAYRSFLGRFRSHIESGRHPEYYIKYSVEDLETAVLDFFKGCAVPQHSREKIKGRIWKWF